LATAEIKKTAKPALERVALVGHEAVRESLRARVLAGEAAHAYLIGGSRGVGKFGVAHELAVLLLCDDPTAAGACGVCPQCQLSRQLQHPDLHILFPLPKKKSADEQEDEVVERVSEVITQRLRELAADPYTDTTLPRARRKDSEERQSRSEDMIRIGYARWLVRIANKKSFQARRKVFVVCQADRMNDEAQSAFLKTLEDPPEQTHFILLTEHESEIKETVRSRCRRVRLNGLPLSLLAEVLAGLGVERARAASVAALSRGSVARARDLLNTDLHAIQERIIDFMRTAATGCNPFKLQELIADFTDQPDGGRERVLDLMVAFWHDISVFRAYGGQPPVPLAFDAFKEVMGKLVSSFPAAAADRAVADIELAASHLERYYTPEFVYYSLAIRLREAFGSRTSVRPAASSA
jgi:DNA polymerase III subunit delta'